MMISTLKALQSLGGSASIQELNNSALDIMQLPNPLRDIPIAKTVRYPKSHTDLLGPEPISRNSV